MIDKKVWIINKKFLTIFVTILMAYLALNWMLSKPTQVLTANCTQLGWAGKFNISTSSKYYNPALDRNHNGIACER